MSDSPTVSLPINPAATSMPDVQRAALAALRRHGPAGEGREDLPADVSVRIVTREGITVGDVRRLPLKAFLLVLRSGDNEHRQAPPRLGQARAHIHNTHSLLSSVRAPSLPSAGCLPASLRERARMRSRIPR
jgi:hypothetical protein